MANRKPSFGKLGDRRRKIYLAALAAGKSKMAAAEAVGVSRELVRLYRKRHKAFAQLEEQAQLDGIQARADKAEDALCKAAEEGNVRACETVLYNLRPERWKKQQTVTLSMGEIDREIERLLANLAVEGQPPAAVDADNAAPSQPPAENG